MNYIIALAFTFLSWITLLQKFLCWCNEICISYRRGSEPRNRMMLSKRLEREASTRAFPKSSIFIEIPRNNYFKRIVDCNTGGKFKLNCEIINGAMKKYRNFTNPRQGRAFLTVRRDFFKVLRTKSWLWGKCHQNLMRLCYRTCAKPWLFREGNYFHNKKRSCDSLSKTKLQSKR